MPTLSSQPKGKSFPLPELTLEILVETYQNSRDGQSAVERLCEPYNLPRDWCEDCECNTPTFKKVCAVCFTVRQ